MQHLPKILLVTLTPPGRGNVGEIILNDLCRFLPPEGLAVCSVGPIPLAVEGFDHLHIPAPIDAPWRPLPGRLGGLCNSIYVRTCFARRIKRMISKIAGFARQKEVEAIWITLNSLPLIAVGGKLAEDLGLPQFSLVWDPPDWAARGRGWDSISRKWLIRRFEQAIGASKRVMVVSQGMVDEYRKDYGASCVIVRHALKKPTPVKPRDKQVCRIGFAGTFYETAQLNLFLRALNSCNWKIGNRPICLRMIGNYFRFNGLTAPSRVELLGWRTPEETQDLLSECDITYLPISFHADWSDFARLSFPTKLSTYLAAGRPVLVHGPEYASSVQFCKENRFGLTCTSLDVSDLRDTLLNLLFDEKVYLELLDGVVATCNHDFTPEVMKRQFAQFLGVEELPPVGWDAGLRAQVGAA